MVKTISLRQVKSFNAVCELPRDNFDCGDWSIMTDGVMVWISQQKLGESRTDHVAVPKKIFDRLLQKYEKPQLIKKR